MYVGKRKWSKSGDYYVCREKKGDGKKMIITIYKTKRRNSVKQALITMYIGKRR